LFKVDSETWDGVVVGDNSGQFVLDPEQLAAINEQLAPYTSDVMVNMIEFSGVVS